MTAFRHSGIQHLGDVRMVHHRQRLPLGLEPGDDLLGVHAQLDDFQRDAPPHRLGLLGDIDHAAAAFADAFQQLVAPERLAHGFVRGVREVDLEGGTGCVRLCGQQGVGLVVSHEQGFETSPQGWIPDARAVEECGTLSGRVGERGIKQAFLALLIWAHGSFRVADLPLHAPTGDQKYVSISAYFRGSSCAGRDGDCAPLGIPILVHALRPIAQVRDALRRTADSRPGRPPFHSHSQSAGGQRLHPSPTGIRPDLGHARSEQQQSLTARGSKTQRGAAPRISTVSQARA